MSLIIGIISGIFSGVLSSIIAQIIFRMDKPKILISDKIAKNEQNEYRIKVVNKSKKYAKNMMIYAQ